MFLVDEISTSTIRQRRHHGALWIAVTALAAFLLMAAGLWASAFAATSSAARLTLLP